MLLQINKPWRITIVLFAAAWLNAITFGSEEIFVGPYLQNVTQTSVTVCWITKADVSDKVKYGLNDKTDLIAVGENDTLVLHKVVLENLKAGKDYNYSVQAGNQILTGTFRTSPEPEQPFTFAVWGDNRTFPNEHRQVLNQMAKHKPHLAISVGDIVTNGRDIAEYKKEFFDPDKQFFANVPFFVAVGNHEYIEDKLLKLLKSIIVQPGNERFFAFTYGNSRFIILDSNDKSITKGAQLDWLKNEFNTDAYKSAEFRFLFLHHAPYCWDWYGGQNEIKESIVPLAEKNKIDIFFGGHFHCYERGMKKLQTGHNIYYVVTGGGGAEFTTPSTYGPGGNKINFMTEHDWKYHFIILKIDGKKFDYTVKDKDGAVMDSFSDTH